VARRHYTLREDTLDGAVLDADYSEGPDDPHVGQLVASDSAWWRVVNFMLTDSRETHSNTLIVERVD
jgi:hypothetical protein